MAVGVLMFLGRFSRHQLKGGWWVGCCVLLLHK